MVKFACVVLERWRLNAMICINAEYVQRIHISLRDRMTSVPEELASATLKCYFQSCIS